MNPTFDLYRYYGNFVLRLKAMFAYRFDFVYTFLFRMATPLVMVFLWSAVFHATSSVTLNGVNLIQIITYFFITGAISATSLVNCCWRINDYVITGKLYAYLNKPVSFPMGLFIERLTSGGFYTVVTAIPIFIAGILLFNIQLSWSMLPVFVLEMLILYVTSYLIGFTLGCVSFYMIDATGIFSVSLFAMTLLGGGLIPLNFFPAWASNILQLLPFQYSAYLPAATLSGELSASAIPGELLLALGWTVALMLVAWFVWSRAAKRMDVVGV